jgi:hypothetical protein
MNDIDAVLSQLVGRETPGGCGTCDAYQTVREWKPGIWSLTVHHDDYCPEWRARDAGTN